MIEIFGTLAYTELPDEYSLAVGNAFKDLLDNPEADIIYLVELSPYDPAQENTVGGIPPFGTGAFGEFDFKTLGGITRIYLSNVGYTTKPDDAELPNQHFAAQVDNQMQFDVSVVSGDDFGSQAPSFGSIVIQNAEGELDILQDYVWTGYRVTVKAGQRGFAYEDFATVFGGSINGIEMDDDRVTLTIRDNRIKTDQLLLPATFAGTGGKEGGTDLSGKPKPLCYGVVRNIEPVLVDPANLIYQIHDGSIQSVDVLRDSGVELTSAGDVADITAATVAAGQFKTQLSGGYIKLGSTPSGRITADVHGSTVGGFVSTVGDIVQRILTSRLGVRSFSAAEIDQGAFNRLNDEMGFDAGVYLTDRVRASDVIDALINPLGAWWTFTRQGLLTCGLVDEPGVATVEITEDDIEESGVQVLAVIPPSWRLSVGYAPVGVVQKEDELAGATTEADRAFLGEAYRFAVSENLVVRAQNEQAIERIFETQLADLTGAQALLTRLSTVYTSKRRLYRVPVWRMLFRVYIGDTVRLTYPRHGLSAGRNLLVLGVSEDVETGITNLELWG